MVLDELVTLKKELFSLYPDLNSFLTSTHKKFLTGNKKQQKNEWGEWENEPMYAFNTHRVQRDWCTYTSFCNGYLMQTPSAVGAKAALTEAVRKYYRHPDVNILAFIHDEILFEVRKGAENKHELIADVAEIMLDKMQEVLYNVRIAVEADLMSYWKKSGGHWQKTFWKDPGKKELRSA